MSIRTEEWREFALCREVDPELFHMEDDEHAKIELAKSICVNCDVLEECRRWALNTPSQRGVCGGLSKDDRIELRFSDRKGVAA